MCDLGNAVQKHMNKALHAILPSGIYILIRKLYTFQVTHIHIFKWLFLLIMCTLAFFKLEKNRSVEENLTGRSGFPFCSLGFKALLCISLPVSYFPVYSILLHVGTTVSLSICLLDTQVMYKSWQ